MPNTAASAEMQLVSIAENAALLTEVGNLVSPAERKIILWIGTMHLQILKIIHGGKCTKMNQVPILQIGWFFSREITTLKKLRSDKAHALSVMML